MASTAAVTKTRIMRAGMKRASLALLYGTLASCSESEQEWRGKEILKPALVGVGVIALAVFLVGLFS